MTAVLIAVAGLLADEAPRNTGPDFGKASPIGLLIIVLLMIATFFLIRSMNRHLKKVPESFDVPNPEDNAEPEQPAGDGAGEDLRKPPGQENRNEPDG